VKCACVRQHGQLAGELESGNAGEPARLIRQRYREAAEVIKKGNMCSLFINDLDAGAGRMGDMTQYTVNNQMVNATLMNIADNPTNVQLPGVYRNDPIPRVPIVCTGVAPQPCTSTGAQALSQQPACCLPAPRVGWPAAQRWCLTWTRSPVSLGSVVCLPAALYGGCATGAVVTKGVPIAPPGHAVTTGVTGSAGAAVAR
jgi:hypothetical protein